jgi:MerR family copper efflux transcriptional regulator
MASREESLACTLSGPELSERIREWTDVASQATSREVHESRVVSRYPADPHLLARLRNLIAAEAECCPFIEFHVEERPTHFVVELRVPPDMGGVLSVMLGLISGQGSEAVTTI